MRLEPDGTIRVMLVTSRETRRWIIPKGWPMRGLPDHEAAAREAEEEAGLVGQVQDQPFGSYTYWKRRSAHFDLCAVAIYILEVERELETWREKGQRKTQWFSIREAAERVQEPGLRAAILSLAAG